MYDPNDNITIAVEYIPIDGIEETFLRYRFAGTDDKTDHLVALGRIQELIQELRKLLKRDPLDLSDLSPEDTYRTFRNLCRDASEHHRRTGEVCMACLNPLLIGKEGMRVEMIDVKGDAFRYTVQRTPGVLPVHVHRGPRSTFPIPAAYVYARVIG
jgi:hypothetical protein